MSVREILEYPHPVLRRKARPVEAFDASLKRLVEEMAETMYAAPGVGLAAPQIGEGVRVVVIDVTPAEEGKDLLVLVNPVLQNPSGSIEFEEGCLSLPGLRGIVRRAARIEVEAFDAQGRPWSRKAEGLLAVAFQHEVDHLDGLLFVDRLSPLKRELALKAFRKGRGAGKTPPPELALAL